MTTFLPQIWDAFTEVTSEKKTDTWIKKHSPSDPTEDSNEFIFFLKPEATDLKAGVNVKFCLETALTLLQKGVNGKPVHINGIRVVGGTYLDKNDIMVQHYGVIAKISREGESAISEAARQVLKTKFAEDIAGWNPEHYKSHILGGHQFLAKFPQFNAFSLLALNDNLTITRLGPGTYAIKLKVRGETFIVLNSFHPYQVVPYNTPGNAIIVLSCYSTASFEDLRGQLAGPTDPTTAPQGSIRRTFLENKNECGLKDVDRGSNCIHMSAGPLEGMVELKRFFSDSSSTLDYENTSFGKLLLKKGLSKDKLTILSTNPDVQLNDKKQSAFDFTEEKNADEAAAILLSAK